MSDRPPVYAIVCAGGGAHGAYQVGVIRYIHEHFCIGEASPFRIFAGTSAGSLNTTFLACRSSDARVAVPELETMWREFDVPQYHGNVALNAVRALVKNWTADRDHRKPCWSLLGPDPLIEVVGRGFDRAALDRSIAAGTTHGAAVSATELRSSRLVFFEEGPAATSWNSGIAISIETALDVPHVVASCSVPIAFPPVHIGDHFYSDGGVANKVPLSPAISMGATRVLSVATDQPLPDHLPEYPEDFRPHLSDVLRMLTGQLSYDYATPHSKWIEAASYFREQLPSDQLDVGGRMLEGREIRLSSFRSAEIELFAPSRRIGYTDLFDPEFFDPEAEGVSTTLRFKAEFVGRLIELGYADAGERHEQLATFFDAERPQRASIYAEA